MRIVNFLGVPQNKLEEVLVFVAERVHDQGPKVSAREMLAAIERLAGGLSPEQVKAQPPPTKEDVERQGALNSAAGPALRDPGQDVDPHAAGAGRPNDNPAERHLRDEAQGPATKKHSHR